MLCNFISEILRNCDYKRIWRSDICVFWSRYGVEVWWECFKVTILWKVNFTIVESALRFGLSKDFRGAKGIFLRNKIILVNSFCVKDSLQYWRLKFGLSSFFSTILAFLAKYSGLGLLKKSPYVVLPSHRYPVFNWSEM